HRERSLRRSGRGFRRVRGALLLEVVFALALFVGAATVLLGGFNASTRAAQNIKIEATAEDLAVTVMSQIQMGLIPTTDNGPNPIDDPNYDGWTWQLVTADVTTGQQTPGAISVNLKRVEVIIANPDAGFTRRLSRLVAPNDNLTGLTNTSALGRPR